MFIEIELICSKCSNFLSYEIREGYRGDKTLVVDPCQDCINEELNYLEEKMEKEIRSQYENRI